MPLLQKKDHSLEEVTYWLFSDRYNFTDEQLRNGSF
jgi:hypothetical protein